MTVEATDVPVTRAPLDEKGRSILFYEARTANSFADTPVTDAELSQIWDLAKWPPTAANTQPLRVLYVRTPEGKERLVKHMADGNKAKTASAPAVAVLSIDPDYHEHIPTLFPMRPQMKDVFAANPEMRDASGRFSGALQAGYFILAVRAAGLVAGPMAGYDAAGIEGEFFPEGDRKVQLVVNIGHPGENPWFDRLPRLDDEVALDWA
ncbi:malonic semialdehyde reductase [Streptomyces sp. SL13]|jgi:3-hydroxypropanoate dehydrogenase|uniref:Malonic semialdehyde reductase n=1 Tax=Streptantibioticus silvisoli TaxID=2705255 RepID=A0AA90H378_9ACTN|nr:malonic semialdehyde reductase [Streptantibioticus silvisoli]MDI5965573.1 malonic semialdehyde reductase [Streptantibioticus silvisoli]MDI5972594.1 malonic semialdehyde reductase [Streptantibioticus silvisoli]